MKNLPFTSCMLYAELYAVNLHVCVCGGGGGGGVVVLATSFVLYSHFWYCVQVHRSS